jgi:hypothetical protein
MGWVLMSERDVRRIEVLTEVFSGRRTVASAAVVLAITVRQVNRLLIRLRENGGGGLIHKGRGQSSNHRLSPGIRLCSRAGKYQVCGLRPDAGDRSPARQEHDIQVGRETLRTWMVQDGLWLSRKQRRSFHQPRLRRESYGELVQIDGSDHRWFEQRTPTSVRCRVSERIMGALSRFTPTSTPSSASTSGCEGRLRYNAVRSCAGGAQHRDSMRQLKPG